MATRNIMALLGQRLVIKRNEKSFNWIPAMLQRIFTLTLIIAILAAEKSAEGSFDLIPIDAFAGKATAGAEGNLATYFNCSTSNSPIDPRDLVWAQYPLDGIGQRSYVYDDGRIMAAYKDRFDVEVDVSSGTCNLLVLRPELKDAGRYECIDVRSSTGVSAELTVHEPNLTCKSDKDLNEVVGPTECDLAIPPDKLQLSCSVSYRGRNSPPMKWIKATDLTNTLETECITNGGQLICNTKVTATLQEEGSVYSCQIAAGNYNCSLDFKNTLYVCASKSRLPIESYEEKEATCVPNASTQLAYSYTWYRDHVTLVSSESTVKLTETGLYACRAQCAVRSNCCAFTAMEINFRKIAYRSSLWLLVVLPLLLLIIVAIVVFIWKRKVNCSKKISVPESQCLRETEAERVELNVSAEYNIQKVFNRADYVSKGLSGDIYGPLQYKDIRCAIERIMCSTDQQTTTNEREVMKEEKEEKICSNGKKWMALNHENLMRFYNVVQQSPAIYIVMEYAEGGSVRKALNRCTEDLPMTVVEDWSTQIAKGMHYLHKNDITHKSLRCDYIFSMEPLDTIRNQTLKIACRCLSDEYDALTGCSVRKTVAYWPPEVVRGEYYSKGSDVWSFGLVVWEMLTKDIPYNSCKVLPMIIKDILEGATTIEIPNLCTEALKKILKDCRQVDPSERPSFSEILSNLGSYT